MSDFGWADGGRIYLAGFLLWLGLVCFITSLVRADRTSRRDLRKFHARVGRDVWRDIKGLTK